MKRTLISILALILLATLLARVTTIALTPRLGLPIFVLLQAVITVEHFMPIF